MKRTMLLSMMVIFILVISSHTVAQKPDIRKEMEKAAKQAYMGLLKETDKDKDGKISKTEFFAIWKDKKAAEEKFAFWDTNKDGYITEEEYVKAVVDIVNKKKK